MKPRKQNVVKPRKQKTTSADLPGWQPQPQSAPHGLYVKRGDALLGVVTYPDPAEGCIHVIAIETDKKSVQLGVDGVLGNHAHVNLGRRRTQAGARALGERYAREWLREKVTPEKCKCGDVET